MGTVKNSKKHRFNAVDAAIIAVIIAVIGAAAFLFTAGGVSSVSSTVSIEYVVELRTVKNEFTNNFAVGEKLVDSVAKYQLGEVIHYSVSETVYNGNDMQNGKVVSSFYPGHSDVALTVAAEASVGAGGRYVIDGGYDISVGTTVYVRLPNYTGVGYCTALRETEAQ